MYTISTVCFHLANITIFTFIHNYCEIRRPLLYGLLFFDVLFVVLLKFQSGVILMITDFAFDNYLSLKLAG